MLIRFVHQGVKMRQPKFTEKQKQYLQEILTLPYCHVSGMHDPEHYRRGGYICNIQKSKDF